MRVRFAVSMLFPLFLILCAVPVFADNPSSDLEPVLFSAAGINRSDIESARSKKTMTLFDLYSLSVYRTERMAIEGENGVQAQAHRMGAIGQFLPQLQFSASKYYPSPETGNSFLPRSTVALYAQQNIITGLKEISQFRKAGAETRMREHTLRDAAGQLLLDVSGAYMNVIRITKGLRNREKILDNYRGIAAELEKRVAIGRSRPSELLQIKSQIFTITAQIESMKNSLEQAQNVLSYLTGMPLPILISETIPDAKPASLTAEPVSLIVGRYDVRAAQEQLDMANAGLIAAYGGFAPNLYITGGDRIYQQTMKGHDYYVGLNATMPLFSGGETLAAVKESRSLVRQAELTLSQTKRKAVQQITDGATAYRSTLHQIESYRKALEVAEVSYRTLLEEYRLKLVSILDVFSALTTLENARDAYEGVVIDHQLSRISFGVATGELIGSGIDQLRREFVSAAEGVSK
jgi:outer membrane protein